MMADNYWSIKRDLNNIEIISYVHESFISAVSLLNDLMKILIGRGIFNRVFFKDFGSDCNCKIVFLNKQTSIVGLNTNCEVSTISSEKKWKNAVFFFVFFNNEVFLYSKNGSEPIKTIVIFGFNVI